MAVTALSQKVMSDIQPKETWGRLATAGQPQNKIARMAILNSIAPSYLPNNNLHFDHSPNVASGSDLRAAYRAANRAMNWDGDGADYMGGQYTTLVPELRAARMLSNGYRDAFNTLGSGIDYAWDNTVAKGIGAIAGAFDKDNAENVERGLQEFMNGEDVGTALDIGSDVALSFLGPIGWGISGGKAIARNAGNLADAAEGYNTLTGEKMSDEERLMKLGGSLADIGLSFVPSGGGIVRGGKVLVKGLGRQVDDVVKHESQDILEALAKQAEKSGKLNIEDFHVRTGEKPGKEVVAFTKDPSEKTWKALSYEQQLDIMEKNPELRSLQLKKEGPSGEQLDAITPPTPDKTGRVVQIPGEEGIYVPRQKLKMGKAGRRRGKQSGNVYIENGDLYRDIPEHIRQTSGGTLTELIPGVKGADDATLKAYMDAMGPYIPGRISRAASTSGPNAYKTLQLQASGKLPIRKSGRLEAFKDNFGQLRGKKQADNMMKRIQSDLASGRGLSQYQIGWLGQQMGMSSPEVMKMVGTNPGELMFDYLKGNSRAAKRQAKRWGISDEVGQLEDLEKLDEFRKAHPDFKASDKQVKKFLEKARTDRGKKELKEIYDDLPLYDKIQHWGPGSVELGSKGLDALTVAAAMGAQGLTAGGNGVDISEAISDPGDMFAYVLPALLRGRTGFRKANMFAASPRLNDISRNINRLATLRAGINRGMDMYNVPGYQGTEQNILDYLAVQPDVKPVEELPEEEYPDLMEDYYKWAQNMQAIQNGYNQQQQQLRYLQSMPPQQVNNMLQYIQKR